MAVVYYGLLVSAISAVLRTADCYCYPSTLYAETLKSKSKVVPAPSIYEICTIDIRPDSNYNKDYYFLEISWSSTLFDVKGNMPLCNGDYVEVFLTRSYRSIGKFCSHNAESPFTMYSKDGYARIEYYNDGDVSGKGFKFFYQLRAKHWSSLGDSPTSSVCYNTGNFGSSAVIYSTGWPSGYKKVASSCDYEIKRPYGYIGTYLVFMDVDLNNFGYPRDYVQLYGSNSSRYSTKPLSRKLQSTYWIKKYTVYEKYLKIKLIRRYGPGRSSLYRGFVAGYVMFKSPRVIDESWNKMATNDTTPNVIPSSTFNSQLDSVVLGILVPAIIIIFIVIFVFVHKKRQQGHNARSTTVNQPLYAAVPPSTQHSAAQGMTQPSGAVSSTNEQFSEPFLPYSTGSAQTGSHSPTPYPMHAGAPLPYPTGPVTAAYHAPPDYATVSTSSYSGTAAEPLQNSNSTGAEPQQSTAGSFVPIPVSSSYGGNIPTVQVADPLPSAPPPSYDSVMRG